MPTGRGICKFIRFGLALLLFHPQVAFPGTEVNLQLLGRISEFNVGSMQHSTENYLLVAALSFLAVSEKAWLLARKIITFFDERAERAARKRKKVHRKPRS